MQLGDVANEQASALGRPLDGVRVLAVEQMQALPFATQLMARLGAEVIKVEHPVHGESGRGAQPSMADPAGRSMGATFLRNNLSKRSLGVDLKSAEGRDLVLRLAERVDVFAENFKAGAMGRMGLGYDDVAAVNSRCVYLSVSGFGNTVPSPYDSWPAYAPIVEAMSGLYEYRRTPGQPPLVAPAGALGDIGTSLFGVIGVLAALRHRDATGEGQYVDIAMLDSMVSFGDIVTNFWSMGLRPDPERGNRPNLIMDGFEAEDGWFVVQVGREHQFARLAETIGHPEWVDDPRFADRAGWVEHLDGVIRPAIDAWAAGKTKLEVCTELSSAGIAAGPCFAAADVIDDPHVAARHMLVSLPRPNAAADGTDEPVLVPGNPVKLSKVVDGGDRRVPWIGEHTEAILGAELGLSAAELATLRAAGVIT